MVAYLDAGSGSLIVTAVVGGAAGVGVALRSLKGRITGAFSRSKDEAPESEAIDSPAVTADAES